MSEWISVKDRLPETWRNVMILTDYGGIDVCYLSRDNEWRNALRPQHSDGNVTHWMPLPEPPEEARDGNDADPTA